MRERAKMDKKAYNLSDRERQVLRMTASGLTSLKIAEELGISAATVRSHLANSVVKLSAKTTANAVAIAVRDGIVSPDDQASLPRAAG